MAVALSSVTKGSSVQIPLINGDTMDFIVMGYNHYGKGESTLLANPSSEDPPMTVFYRNSLSPKSYINSGFDLILNDFEHRLAESIKKSLIYVTIPVSYILGDYQSPNTTTAKRAIFLPSITEVGGGKPASSHGSYGTVYWTSIGTSFGVSASSLNAAENNGVGIYCRDIYGELWRPSTGSTSYSRLGAVYLDTSGILQTSGINIGYSSVSSSNVDSLNVNPKPFICVSGSVMVNSSSGGLLRKRRQSKVTEKSTGSGIEQPDLDASEGRC